MEMNDPLRREEKKESSPDQDKSGPSSPDSSRPVSYTHLRAHETLRYLV